MVLELTASVRDRWCPQERQTAPRRQTRFTYVDGPAHYLAQQVCATMQRGGWPSVVAYSLRSPQAHNRLYEAEQTNLDVWESPHVFGEAANVWHPSLQRQVSAEYWRAFQDAVYLVSRRYSVDIDSTSSGHLELADWRAQQPYLNSRPPHPAELQDRFRAVLPAVYRQYERSAAALKKSTIR